MRPTARLSNAVRITLFTRPNCGLCDSAKTVLSGLRARRPFTYREVDIGAAEAAGWRDLYDFDVPVVCLPRLFFSWSPGIVVALALGSSELGRGLRRVDPRQQGLRAGGGAGGGGPGGEADAQVHGGRGRGEDEGCGRVELGRQEGP